MGVDGNQFHFFFWRLQIIVFIGYIDGYILLGFTNIYTSLKAFGSFRLPATTDDPLLEVLAAIDAKKLVGRESVSRAERSGSTTTEGSGGEEGSATCSSSESDAEIEEVSKRTFNVVGSGVEWDFVLGFSILCSR